MPKEEASHDDILKQLNLNKQELLDKIEADKKELMDEINTNKRQLDQLAGAGKFGKWLLGFIIASGTMAITVIQLFPGEHK